MGLALVTDPKKTVNTIDSDVASTVQLRYEFKREDYEIIAVADDGGEAQLILAVALGDVSGDFTEGDIVYFKEDADEYPAGLYDINTIGFATNTKLTLTLAFSDTGEGYINHMERVKHRIEVSIFDSAGTTLLLENPLSFAGNQAGNIIFDLAKFIKGHLLANDLISIIYKVKWREAFTGFTPPALASLDNIQAIRSLLPLLHDGGSNMWDFLLDSVTVKFLTKFTNPVLWDGWKREIGYVIDSNYTPRLTNVPKSLFRYLDQNRVFISNSDATARSATANIYTLPLKVAAIPATASFIDAKIIDNVTSAVRTETLQFQILQECKNPIMIEWLNSLGHYEQHIFEMNQEFNDSVKEGLEWERTLTDDISTENNLTGRIEGDLNQIITMADQDLTIDQIQALREIKSSPDVRIFLAKDGSSFINVSVNSIFDTLFNTDNSIHEMQLSVKLPKNVNFFDSKLY